MNLRQVVRTVRAHWVVALVTFLVCLLIGAAYAVVPAKQYEATVVLLAQPPAGPDGVRTSLPFRSRSPDRGGSGERVGRRRRSRPGAQALPIGAGDDLGNRGSFVQHRHDQRHEHGPGRRPGVCQRHGGAGARVTDRDAGSLLVLSELGVAELPTAPSNPRATVAVAASSSA